MIEYKGYVGKVEFDGDARIFHGEVVGIRDVVTFQGRSVREIERAFRASVDDYLAFCRERGEAPDSPCSGRFVVRIDPVLHRRVNVLAVAQGKSLNAFVAEALEQQAQASRASPSRARREAKRGKARRKSAA